LRGAHLEPEEADVDAAVAAPALVGPVAAALRAELARLVLRQEHLVGQRVVPDRLPPQIAVGRALRMEDLLRLLRGDADQREVVGLGALARRRWRLDLARLL